MKLTAERNEMKRAQMVIFEIDDCELANLPAGFAAVVEWRSEGITISQRLAILSRAASEIEMAQARRHLVITERAARIESQRPPLGPPPPMLLDPVEGQVDEPLRDRARDESVEELLAHFEPEVEYTDPEGGS